MFYYNTLWTIAIFPVGNTGVQYNCTVKALRTNGYNETSEPVSFISMTKGRSSCWKVILAVFVSSVGIRGNKKPKDRT